MNVVEIRKIEDCFDGSMIKEVVFDRELTTSFIDYLGKAGEYEFYSTFERPYFKIDVDKRYIVKGVLGNSTVRLILARENPEDNLKAFTAYVRGFNSQSL